MIPPMKHCIQATGAINAGAANATLLLAQGTVNPDPYTTNSACRNGSLIKSLTIQFDVASLLTQVDTLEWYVWFNVNGAQTQPDAQNVTLSHLKNQVFHQDGAIYANGASTASPYEYARWRVVVKVPKSLQQLNDGDKLELIMRGNVNTAGAMYYRICVIYKEIFP